MGTREPVALGLSTQNCRVLQVDTISIVVKRLPLSSRYIRNTKINIRFYLLLTAIKHKGSNMKFNALLTAICVALSLSFSATPVFAVDYEFFLRQSCEELSKEKAILLKGEAAITESMNKKDSDARTTQVVTAIFTGWAMWGNVDHGNATEQLKEIRLDLKYVNSAMKDKKCSSM